MNYQYDGNHRADFSRARGSLQLGEFGDERGLADGRVIVDGYQAESELSALLRNALVQGFEHGNATLVESEGDFVVAGGLTSIETAEVADGIQLTMRVNLQLNRGARTIWQTNLFGRGAAEDIASATPRRPNPPHPRTHERRLFPDRTSMSGANLGTRWRRLPPGATPFTKTDQIYSLIFNNLVDF